MARLQEGDGLVKIQDVKDPTANQDVATKSYVDGLVAGVHGLETSISRTNPSEIAGVTEKAVVDFVDAPIGTIADSDTNTVSGSVVKAYVDAPAGTIADGVTLPVSGAAVKTYVDNNETDTTYTAGTGITIDTDNEVSVTNPFTDADETRLDNANITALIAAANPVFTDTDTNTTYTGGAGIDIDAANEITTDSTIATQTDVADFFNTHGVELRTYSTQVLSGTVTFSTPANATEVEVGTAIGSHGVRILDFGDQTVDVRDGTYYRITTGQTLGYYALYQLVNNGGAIDSFSQGYFIFLDGTDVLSSAVSGTAIVIDTDEEIHPFVYHPFTGASDTADGFTGLVPTPVAGDEGKVLKGDGTWQTETAGMSYTGGTDISIDASNVISVDPATTLNSQVLDQPTRVVTGQSITNFVAYEAVANLRYETIASGAIIDRKFISVGTDPSDITADNQISVDKSGNFYTISVRLALTDERNILFDTTTRFIKVYNSIATDGIFWTLGSAPSKSGLLWTFQVNKNPKFTSGLSGVQDNLTGDVVGEDYSFELARTTADVELVTSVDYGDNTIDVDSYKITSLATPTADGDAATKAYVDSSNPAAFVKSTSIAADNASVSFVDQDDNTTTFTPDAVPAVFVKSTSVAADNTSVTFTDQDDATTTFTPDAVPAAFVKSTSIAADNTSVTFTDQNDATTTFTPPVSDGSSYIVDSYTGTVPTVTGSNAIAIGTGADADNTNAIVIGTNASNTNGSNAVAMGNSAQAGDNSVAIGTGADADSTGKAHSIAIGTQAVSEQDHSIAFGRSATTTAANQMVIGSTTASTSISAIVTPGFTGGTGEFISIDAAGNWGTSAPPSGEPAAFVKSTSIDGNKLTLTDQADATTDFEPNLYRTIPTTTTGNPINKNYVFGDNQYPYTTTTDFSNLTENLVYVDDTFTSVYRILFDVSSFNRVGLNPSSDLIFIQLSATLRAAYKIVLFEYVSQDTEIYIDFIKTPVVGDTDILLNIASGTELNVGFTSLEFPKLNEIPTPGATVDLGTEKITSSTAPTDADDLTNKSYVDTNIDALKYYNGVANGPLPGNINKNYDNSDLPLPYSFKTTLLPATENDITLETAADTHTLYVRRTSLSDVGLGSSVNLVHVRVGTADCVYQVISIDQGETYLDMVLDKTTINGFTDVLNTTIPADTGINVTWSSTTSSQPAAIYDHYTNTFPGAINFTYRSGLTIVANEFRFTDGSIIARYSEADVPTTEILNALTIGSVMRVTEAGNSGFDPQSGLYEITAAFTHDVVNNLLTIPVTHLAVAGSGTVLDNLNNGDTGIKFEIRLSTGGIGEYDGTHTGLVPQPTATEKALDNAYLDIDGNWTEVEAAADSASRLDHAYAETANSTPAVPDVQRLALVGRSNVIEAAIDGIFETVSFGINQNYNSTPSQYIEFVFGGTLTPGTIAAGTDLFTMSPSTAGGLFVVNYTTPGSVEIDTIEDLIDFIVLHYNADTKIAKFGFLGKTSSTSMRLYNTNAHTNNIPSGNNVFGIQLLNWSVNNFTNMTLTITSTEFAETIIPPSSSFGAAQSNITFTDGDANYDPAASYSISNVPDGIPAIANTFAFGINGTTALTAVRTALAADTEFTEQFTFTSTSVADGVISSLYTAKAVGNKGAFTFSLLGGMNNTPSLVVSVQGTDSIPAMGNATTYTVTDGSGSESTSFTNFVTSASDDDSAIVAASISMAIGNVTETPINYTPSLSGSTITLTADAGGVSAGDWTVTVDTGADTDASRIATMVVTQSVVTAGTDEIISYSGLTFPTGTIGDSTYEFAKAAEEDIFIGQRYVFWSGTEPAVSTSQTDYEWSPYSNAGAAESVQDKIVREGYKSVYSYNTDGDLQRKNYTRTGQDSYTQLFVYNTDGDLTTVRWLDGNLTQTEAEALTGLFETIAYTYNSDGDLTDKTVTQV